MSHTVSIRGSIVNSPQRTVINEPNLKIKTSKKGIIG
jgi:hypothetical protein